MSYKRTRRCVLMELDEIFEVCLSCGQPPEDHGKGYFEVCDLSEKQVRENNLAGEQE